MYSLFVGKKYKILTIYQLVESSKMDSSSYCIPMGFNIHCGLT